MTLNEKIAEVKAEIKEHMKKHDIMNFSTCDSPCYGWDQMKHHAMLAIQQDGLAGYKISCKYKFECYGWTIIKL